MAFSHINYLPEKISEQPPPTRKRISPTLSMLAHLSNIPQFYNIFIASFIPPSKAIFTLLQT